MARDELRDKYLKRVIKQAKKMSERKGTPNPKAVKALHRAFLDFKETV